MKQLFLVLWLMGAMSILACGSTGTTNPGNGDTASDTFEVPPDTIINPDGGEIGDPCEADSECRYNLCVNFFCADPNTNEVIVGTGGTCNWIDNPADCVDWKCFYEDGRTVCRHNDQSVPNGNYGWDCVDNGNDTICVHRGGDAQVPNGNYDWECVENGTAVTCTYQGDQSGSENGRVLVTDPSWNCNYNEALDQTVCTSTGTGGTGEVKNTDPEWQCSYSEETSTTTCVNVADKPDGSPEWACEFPEGGNGTVKICTKEGGNPTPNPNCASGNIEGFSCTPTQVAVSGATVSIEYIDCDGKQAIATGETDALGYFVLSNVPVGAWPLTITKGPYEHTVQVSVQDGKTTSYTDPDDDQLCFSSTDTRIAVVGGHYDMIESVIASLGFSFDFFPGYAPNQEMWDGWEFLLDENRLFQYDIVFINCGVWPEANYGSYMTDLNKIAANLRRYVEAGNYLYASDWAFYFVETAFPDKIDFRGEDLRPIDVLTGARGLHVVSIVDPEMRAFTGMSLATIDLNLTQWAVPVDVSADTKVYLRGDARLTTGAIETDIPYLVDFRYGSGSVAYTSYHIHQNQAIDVFFAFIAMNFK